jgi:hypothetical protein
VRHKRDAVNGLPKKSRNTCAARGDNVAAMLRVGFWNTGRKPVANLVRGLVREHDLNLLVLAERAEKRQRLVEALNGGNDGALWHWCDQVLCERIDFLARFPPTFFERIGGSKYHTAQLLQFPGIRPILITALHQRSQLNQSNDSANESAIGRALTVRRMEQVAGTRHTVVVGDFNVNAFESGMVGALGFHATATRETAAKVSRTVEGEEHMFFYNPMWSFFGDLSPGPPGTYRYWRSEHVCLEWHMLDQVLVRPVLVPAFVPDDLKIVTNVGETSLLTAAGNPTPSDHLPLVFHLDLRNLSNAD